MPEMTSQELVRQFMELPVESLRIQGIVETEDTRYLGAVGLSREQPIFSGILGFSWNGYLSDSARFYTLPLRASAHGRDGVAAVFRQFDSSKYQATPEDLLAGWVPPEDAHKLDTWVADMNAQLARLLELKRRGQS
jgi:hypothetical protein